MYNGGIVSEAGITARRMPNMAMQTNRLRSARNYSRIVGDVMKTKNIEFDVVVKNWTIFADAIEKLGGDVQALSIEDPATESELVALENKLEIELPIDLKDVLLNFSRKVEYRWFMPNSYNFEGELSQIFSGERHWSLDWLIEFNEAKNGWRDEVFPNQEDPYDSVWHNKLAFHEVGNGDYLAIDLSQGEKQPVVYLSHDDGEGHGVEMSPNFIEFLFVSSKLGCVGAEDWQWLPFVEKGASYINSDCQNAKNFREELGVSVQ